MRVATKTIPDLVLRQLGDLSQKQAKLQNQISSGQHLHKASDSPNAFVRVLNFQTEDRHIEQFQKNLDVYKEVSTTNYNVVDSMKTLINRAQEIATQSDDLKSRDELDIYAVEINEIINQALRLANTESRNKYIFGGTAIGDEPFSATVNDDNKITSVAYNGNENAAEFVVSENLRTDAYILGQNSSGSGTFGLFKDTRTDTDIFDSLINLRDRLEAGDSEAITSESIEDLKREEDNIIFHIGTIGATQSHMENISRILNDRSQALNNLTSKEADVDITETVLMMNQTQISYQAALQSAGQILNTSLLDYIR